ncbi:MAG: hypothetical protein LBE36_07240 [Flavobacteriaceae bacterium]|jgi:hypothetical protein|nr:hypothetical protein [Flavobacteriaceae bacterium]
METLFIYLAKTILASGVMYLYYLLFLKDKTFHHYNRFYLLSAIVISLLLPLLKIRYFTIEVNSDIYVLIHKLQNFNPQKITNHVFNYYSVFAFGFGLVSLFFLMKLIFGIFKINRFKRQFPKENYEGINFYRTNLENAPFSYFRNLFWKNAININSDAGKQILKHEMVHIEQKHSADKILTEIAVSVFWFNPFFHIIKKEIHLIHEYLADKKAIKNADTKAFAAMLLANHFFGNAMPAANPFLSSNLKKRLKMLQKSKTKFSYLRKILALPLLFAIAFIYLVNAKNREIRKENYEISKVADSIKNDTVKISSDTIFHREFEESSVKISELGNAINKKSEELKNLKPDSEDFKNKIEEIGSLSKEIEKIANSDQYKTYQYYFDANEFGDFNGFFNSDEFKKQQKALEEHFNSDEFKDLNNIEFIFPEIPEIPEIPNTAFGTDGTLFFDNENLKFDNEKLKKELEKIRKESEKIAKKSTELAKKQGEIAKKQGEIARQNGIEARKQGEIARKQGEIARQNGIEARKQGEIARQKGIEARKQAEIAVFYFDSNDLGNEKYPEDTKIYINGKKSTKQEMDALNPDDIESVSINSKSKDDKKSAEIRIKTK